MTEQVNTEVSKEATDAAELVKKAMEHRREIAAIEKTLGKKIPREVKDTIKLNKSGGIFVQLSELKALSQRTGKEYPASYNMNFEMMKALVNNEKALEKIRAFVNDEANAQKSLEVFTQAELEKNKEKATA